MNDPNDHGDARPITILMATYNGEAYIREQLDSILSQSFQGFTILVRDDGSSDRTPERVQEYERRYPDKVQLVSDGAVCRCPTANFFQLMRCAASDYVMFADQDDYWFPDKVEVTFNAMERAEAEVGKGTPVLVYADSELADARLNSLRRVFISRHELGFKKLLVRNCVQGCCMMVNRALYERIGGYSDQIDCYDWWMALYASAFGVIRHIPRRLMLYRQHGKNTIGADLLILTLSQRIGSFFRRPVEKARLVRRMMRDSLNRAALFRERYGGGMSPADLAVLDDIIALYGGKGNKLARLWRLFRGRYLFDGRIDRALQALFI